MSSCTTNKLLRTLCVPTSYKSTTLIASRLMVPCSNYRMDSIKQISLNYKRYFSSPSHNTRDTSSKQEDPPAVVEVSKWKRNWDWYKQRFRAHPGSHLSSFLILHEVTAIVPIFGVYYILKALELKFPIPDSLLSEANKRISRLRSMMGFEPLEAQDLTMVYLVASYALVKAVLPLRLAACFALTPFFSRTVVEPILLVTKNLVKRIPRK
ncbi:hypothetical protein BB561_002756 [Smittium simulii]|uniref:Uncharacterized protein n=1 Tax=Smittium simulii TaxID=133385 RepID=A0A2T9YPI5_9FUNG|nr:hypothetical protein BB561_002756 [Smittium simulii]